jgi:hypothetical protein
MSSKSQSIVSRCFVWSALLASSVMALVACGKPPEGSDVQTVIGTTTGQTISYALPSRVLLVGYSDGVGTLFVEAAKGVAERYRAAGWNEQVVLIANPAAGRVGDKQALERYGIKVVYEDPSTPLGVPWLSWYLSKFASIESLEFFGHSSSWGMGLVEDEVRLDVDTPLDQLAGIGSALSSNAFVVLHGCNSGGRLAPFLSKSWGVPVTAALTGTNFQRLHSNGKWYVNEPRQAPSSAWAKQNSVSFGSTLSCAKGGCYRLKPINTGYTGHWGTFESGLGFMKTFCAENVSQDACAKGAARVVIANPSTKSVNESSEWSDVTSVTLDFLCPNTPDSVKRKECFSRLPSAALAGGTGTYSPFRGKTLKCSLHGCEYEDVCKYDANDDAIPGTCFRQAPSNTQPTEYVEEYRLILEGFGRLKGQSSPAPYPSFL